MTPERPAGPEIVRQGTLPTQELGALLAEMERGTPWRDALATLDLPQLSSKRHWFTNREKAAFYLDIAIGGREHALDVGAGSGVIAERLAERFNHVVALEHDADWCAFMRRRYAQDGVERVDVVNASAVPRLPFPDIGFDLVVVNGVLEWIPQGAPVQTPRAAQLGFLREVRRVLRPGGAVGIAIENRCFLRNFLGYGPHGEPPYAVLMPRLLADWYTRRSRGAPYRTWLYSYWGYRRLLREAGFDRILIQQVLPSYHTPELVAAVRDARAARRGYTATRGPRGLFLDALCVGGLLGYLGHSFYISAWR